MEPKTITISQYLHLITILQQNPQYTVASCQRYAKEFPNGKFLAPQWKYEKLEVSINPLLVGNGITMEKEIEKFYFYRGREGVPLESAVPDEMEQLATGKKKIHKATQIIKIICYDLEQTSLPAAQLDDFLESQTLRVPAEELIEQVAHIVLTCGIRIERLQSAELPVLAYYDNRTNTIWLNESANSTERKGELLKAFSDAYITQTSTQPFAVSELEKLALLYMLEVMFGLKPRRYHATQIDKQLQVLKPSEDMLQNSFERLHKMSRDIVRRNKA